MTLTEKIKLLAETKEKSFSGLLLRLSNKLSADTAEQHIEKKIKKTATRILNDRVGLLRIKLKQSTGFNIIQCDHCTHFRPIGIQPVAGFCLKSADPNNRPLVSADSFCLDIAPFAHAPKTQKAKRR